MSSTVIFGSSGVEGEEGALLLPSSLLSLSWLGRLELEGALEGLDDASSSISQGQAVSRQVASAAARVRASYFYTRIGGFSPLSRPEKCTFPDGPFCVILGQKTCADNVGMLY